MKDYLKVNAEFDDDGVMIFKDTHVDCTLAEVIGVFSHLISCVDPKIDGQKIVDAVVDVINEERAGN